MIKSKHAFLLASVCTTLNLIASFEEKGISQREDSTDDRKSFSVAVAASQNSGFFTKTWYGVAKTIGKTSAQTYFELADNGTLQADVERNTAEAIRRLEAATEERFKQKDLTSSSNQSKIWKIFDITEKIKSSSGKNFGIHQALAAEYNPLQGQALIDITDNHAKFVQPALQREKEEAITIANQIYNREIESLLTFAAQTAANKRYVHDQAQATNSFDLQKEHHYVSPKTYEALLQSIREGK